MINIQLGGIHALLMAAHCMVMLTLIMAWSPKKSRKELHSRKTIQMVTNTRARFISPCLFDDRTLVRALWMPLKGKNRGGISVIILQQRRDILRLIFISFELQPGVAHRVSLTKFFEILCYIAQHQQHLRLTLRRHWSQLTTYLYIL